MPLLYFNNFRGFKETFLQLRNINFFVGENSTGKTSVLKLIKIITDSSFLYHTDFDSVESDLGYFREIVTYSNPPINSFEIGSLRDFAPNSELIAFKLKYIEFQGLPCISEINLLSKHINLQCTLTNNIYKTRYKTVDLTNLTELELVEYFYKWIKNNELKGIQYISPKVDIPFRNFSIFQIFYQIIVPVIPDDLKITRDLIGLTNFSFDKELYWLAPIRTEPKRTYDNFKTSFRPDGTHSPYILKRLLSKESKTNLPKIVDFFNKFGQESGLFDKIEVNSLGKTETSPFEILVFINNIPHKITNVGYGVSQILPLIVEVISKIRETWFAIQQPEIHLHPKAQAAFGSFVYNTFKHFKHGFIIETHSDYTIDRFRLHLKISNKSESPSESNSQVVFFSRCSHGNKLSCIPILNNGSYCENQPFEFRDFFIKEQLDLLQI